MSVRSNAWFTHVVIVFALLTIVGLWALALAHQDDPLHLGRVIGLAAVSAAVLHALITTGLVAVWGRRPLGVVGIHLLGGGVAAVVMLSTCVGVA